MTIARPTALALALSLALAITGAAACAPADAPPEESEEAMTQRAREIHDRVITLDTHIDISTSNFTAERNYTIGPADPGHASQDGGGRARCRLVRRLHLPGPA